MGYIFEFEHDEKTVWSPNRSVAQLFLAQVQYLEDAIGASAGLTEYMSDTIQIEWSQLDIFLKAIADWANIKHPSFSLLLSGVVVHLLALQSCNHQYSHISDLCYPEEWKVQARSLASEIMERI